MALTFGEINTASDGTGTSIDLGEVHDITTQLVANNIDKSIPFTSPSQKLVSNLFGKTRRLTVIGTIATSASTFVTAINVWFDEAKSTGRYIRTKNDTTARKVFIETAFIPEVTQSDAIIEYQLTMVEGIELLE